MGQSSKKLHRKLKTMAAPLGSVVGGRADPLDIPSIEKFIEDGLVPVHAVDAFVQHLTSHFVEGVSQLPEIAVYAIPDLQDSLPHA